jgi:DNA (cytosine-5)-methyltransferase 1
MASGNLVNAPIWNDVRTLRFKEYECNIDIIYGGFPCQDISIAGTGKGLEGERSGLFFEIIRLTREIRPRFVFLENVPAIRTRGLHTIIKIFTEIGYDCRWTMLRATEFVDQKRERWFLLAKSNCMRCEKRPSETIQQKRQTIFNEKPSDYKLSNMESWATLAISMRKNNGISSKMDRIKSLGNAVVPEQAKEAFKILMGLDNDLLKR